MEYIKFKKTRYLYSLKEASSQPICILGIFLTSDASLCNSSFYREWAENPNQEETGGNATWLIKEDNNIVIWELYDESNVLTEENTFTISKEEFIKLLNEWEKLQKNGPDEIMITYENGKLLIQEIN